MPSALERSQQRAVAAIDGDQARSLVDAYTAAWRRLQPELDALTAHIQAAGSQATPAWFGRQERLRTLEWQILSEVNRIAATAGTSITAAQRQAIRLAEDHARAAVTSSLGPPPPGAFFEFNRLNPTAVEQIVGNAGDGRPLRELLDKLGPAASASVRQALADGMILGEGPLALARRVRQAFGGNAVRAVTVARTETIRAYKQAALESYRANDDVVKGWRWVASLGPRSCAACIAKHGSEHKLDEEFHDHPRGRCAAAPITRTWKELGFDAPERVESTETGAEWFANQPDDVQRRILGPRKLEAVRSGKITLEDLAGSRTDEWGKTLYERSLADALKKTRLKVVKPRKRAPPKPKPPVLSPKEAALADARTMVDDIRRTALSKTARGAVPDLIAAGKRLDEANADEITALLSARTKRDAIQAEYEATTAERSALRKRLEADAKDIRPREDISAFFERVKRFDVYLDPEYKRLGEKLAQMGADISQAQADARHAADQLTVATRRSLAALRPMGGAFDFMSTTSKIVKGRQSLLNEAAVDLPADWIDSSNRGGKILVRATGRRSHYSPSRGVQMSDTDKPTALHELGHRIEHMAVVKLMRKDMPLMTEFEQAFLDYRTPGERATWLGAGYGRDEIAKRDKFTHPYMGKVYAGNFREIVSMGLEGVFHNRYDLIGKDQEYRHFMLGLLAAL